MTEPMEDMPSPTCAMPTTDEYPGPYGFEIQIDGRSSGKNWVVCILCKIFSHIHAHIVFSQVRVLPYKSRIPDLCTSWQNSLEFMLLLFL